MTSLIRDKQTERPSGSKPGGRLLLFAYDYPPSLVGVRRTTKFIRYLHEFGWRCGVISVRAVCASGWDDAPLREVAPMRPAVWRTGSLDPYRICMKFRTGLWPLMRRVYHGPAGGGTGSALPARTGGVKAAAMRFLRRGVFIPDDRVGWLPFAAFAGLAAVRRWKPDALYSTSYPHTAHLAAGIVHAFTGIPWVADFRDGWTQNPAFYHPLTPLHAAIHRRLERWVARRAEAVVTVSPPITEHLQGFRSPNQRPAETIYNGFDDECLPGSGERGAGGTPPPGARGAESQSIGPVGPVGRVGSDQGAASPSRGHDRFELIYGGTFFGTRRPDVLLAAVAVLAGRRPDFRARARVVFYSALDPRWLDRIRELQLESIVDVKGFVSHREILLRQSRADVLALVVDTGPGSEIIVTQKVFEYLAQGKPIWALAGPGACREVLEETGGAALAPPDDAEAAAVALERLFDAWLRGESRGADPARVAPFHRRVQARRLAEILSDLVG